MKTKMGVPRLSVNGNNKRKAEARRKELIKAYESRLALEDHQLYFHDFMTQWLEKTKSTISSGTYYEYRKIVHNSIVPYFEKLKIPLCDLKPYHIQKFYDFKLQYDQVSANTIHHYHANVHKALAYAVKMERISSNPADKIELPKRIRHTANFYSADELKIVLEKAKGTQIEPVVRLATWFGLRRGEIIGLRWRSIDFTNNLLSITGTINAKCASGSKIKKHVL